MYCSRVVTLVLAAVLLTGPSFCQGLFGQDLVGMDHDILRAINIPFMDSKTQYFENGFDGFPAFGLRPGSDIKTPYRLLMPEKLYGEFSVLAAVSPNSKEGGFLFAVVNPLETVVQLGVLLSPADSSHTNISLFYTDLGRHSTSQTVASFVVPAFAKRWTRFALKVTADSVELFFNCHEAGSAAAKRDPQELVFDSASTLYVGQAGPLIKGAFDPRAAHRGDEEVLGGRI
ncbi:collagen alpha-1(XV) chain-like [Bacillus rossius redtenbacheri]|uniref:collagen alpha-1(XV) chain-like n=1 Tax=Bacillus rossius redtenbacheri TaxID=93214 RepID=UPI002FDD9B51